MPLRYGEGETSTYIPFLKKDVLNTPWKKKGKNCRAISFRRRPSSWRREKLTKKKVSVKALRGRKNCHVCCWEWIEQALIKGGKIRVVERFWAEGQGGERGHRADWLRSRTSNTVTQHHTAERKVGLESTMERGNFEAARILAPNPNIIPRIVDVWNFGRKGKNWGGKRKRERNSSRLWKKFYWAPGESTTSVNLICEKENCHEELEGEGGGITEEAKKTNRGEEKGNKADTSRGFYLTYGRRRGELSKARRRWTENGEKLSAQRFIKVTERERENGL